MLDDELTKKLTQIESQIDEEKKLIDKIHELDVQSSLKKYIEYFNQNNQLFHSYIINKNEVSNEPIKDTLISESERMDMIAGILPLADTIRFRRMIFRVTRGSSLLMMDRYNKYGNGGEYDAVFICLFYSSEELRKRVWKVSETLASNLCDKKSFLSNKVVLDQEKLNISKIKDDCTLFILSSLKSLVIGEYSQSNITEFEANRNKSIYSTLSMFKFQDKFYRGLAWVPDQNKSKLQEVLSFIEGKKHLSKPLLTVVEQNTISPPTLLKSNAFIQPFQAIINTYGVPCYQEINPTVITMITFPFLFAIMFGDIMHGLAIMIFGIYLCARKEALLKSDSIMNYAIPLRHHIILFGVFSIYVGFIYNEFAGYSLNLIPSCYMLHSKEPHVSRKEDCTISFGMDSVWSFSENGINYINSLKMKLAVILGSAHMIIGVLFKAMNYLYKKDYLHFFGVFVPQFLYMGSFLSYMCFLIFYKWYLPWTNISSSTAPSIITMLANILLKHGGVDKESQLFDRQEIFSYTVIITMVVSLIWMQTVVPLCHKNHNNDESEEKDSSKLSILKNKPAESSDSPFIYQFIETSEFSLGVISNTASYLRLWALSLAHSELSSVALEYAVKYSLESEHPSFLLLGPGWVFLASFTFGILLVMDSMECLLHTLRLHWVEFQNKFYRGEGHLFAPYSFTHNKNE